MNGVAQNRDSDHFSAWINNTNLVDFTLNNTNFTLIGQNRKRIRIERALVNLEGFNKVKWRLAATPRKNSDHEDLLVHQPEINWGPEPFRVFNIWFKEEE